MNTVEQDLGNKVWNLQLGQVVIMSFDHQLGVPDDEDLVWLPEIHTRVELFTRVWMGFFTGSSDNLQEVEAELLVLRDKFPHMQLRSCDRKVIAIPPAEPTVLCRGWRYSSRLSRGVVILPD